MHDHQDGQGGHQKGREFDEAQQEHKERPAAASDLTDSENKGGDGTSGEAGRTGGAGELSHSGGRS